MKACSSRERQLPRSLNSEFKTVTLLDIIGSYLLLFAGIGLLNYGADRLVSGASHLARALGVRPLLIGLTIVAFGTSAPEFVVSMIAALKHQGGIAYGNIVGSNIANIGLILAVSILITPFTKNNNGFVRIELPILLGVTIALLVFSFNGTFSQQEGWVFAGLALLFIFYIIYAGKKARNGGLNNDTNAGTRSPLRNLGILILGLALLLIGSRLVVDAGIALMRHYGISETVIGLTVIALGTSLPELATAIVSGKTGENDISLGNLIGSNIFNTLFILGGVTSFGAISFERDMIVTQLVILLGMTALIFPIYKIGQKFYKFGGLLLLAAYGLFLYLVVFQPQFKII